MARTRSKIERSIRQSAFSASKYRAKIRTWERENQMPAPDSMWSKFFRLERRILSMTNKLPKFKRY